MTDLTAVMEQIRKAGTNAVRTVPMPGQSVTEGKYQIEVLQESTWVPIATGLPLSTANDMIQKAVNRVICG